MTERPRVAFTTLGCKVNQVESETAAARLAAAGAEVVAPEDADVVVVNTCTVTAEADRKARKAVRHACGLPRGPKVIATGCLACVAPSALAALGDVSVEADRDHLAARVADALGLAGPGPALVARAGEAFNTRVMVKVEDGCDAFCSYCIVPFARGVPRSVPLAHVVAEVAALAHAGVAEVVLTGINVGRYADGDAGLPELVRAVAATGIDRVRLSSVEPDDVTERLLEAAAGSRAFCPHLHVPLQSGSAGVLARMGRRYTPETFERVLDRARRAIPGVAISTDVMVGFPGETEEEAEESAAFVARHGFARLHVFRYSPRPGTLAATLPGRVPAAVAAERSAAMRALGERLSKAFGASLIGTEVEVLVERVAPPGAPGGPWAEGTTRQYARVRVQGASGAPGALVGARVRRQGDGAMLLGEPLPPAR